VSRAHPAAYSPIAGQMMDDTPFTVSMLRSQSTLGMVAGAVVAD
jgi:hypothetical protein